MYAHTIRGACLSVKDTVIEDNYRSIRLRIVINYDLCTAPNPHVFVQVDMVLATMNSGFRVPLPLPALSSQNFEVFKIKAQITSHAK